MVSILCPVALRLQRVSLSANALAATVEYVRVNHSGCHVIVRYQLLHGADVIPVSRKVCGKRVRKVWQVACLASPASLL